MGWLIRIILVLLLLTLVRSLIARLFNLKGTQRRARTSNRPNTAKRTIEGQMVKDPQCGMYVATDLAVVAKSRNQTLHFCSEDCRDKYLQAANL